MRGASAIQHLLDGIPDVPLRLLVVWEPVLVTDIAPPTSGVLARVKDPRAVQLWDPERILSKAMGEVEDGIIWDYVAIYAPGVRWSAPPPEPALEGGTVVEMIEEVRKALSASGPAPPPRPPVSNPSP